jgi:hypothetical protein
MKRRNPPENSIPSGPIPGFLGTFLRFFLKQGLGLQAPERGRDVLDAISLSPQDLVEGRKIRYFHGKKSREIEITLPRNLKEGQRIRLKGMGAEGKGGADPGDLYLEVKVRIPLGERVAGLIGRWLKG